MVGAAPSRYHCAMAAQQFTRNYTDHSNDSGFQFEFHCDKCGNGYRSSFKSNGVGVAAQFLHAAGSIFGGTFNDLGWGADHVKDALRGSAWDGAFGEAVAEIQPKFHQCTRCGKWVCPDVCWNAKRNLCEECAPDIQESASAAQAQVAVEQVWDKARQHDQTGGVDMAQTQVAACPRCNRQLDPGARFCSGCGGPVGAAAAAFCAGCGNALAPGARFCAGCGRPSA